MYAYIVRLVYIVVLIKVTKELGVIVVDGLLKRIL
jgi:hypothetical protein